MVAEIIVDITTSHVDRIFEYAIPREMTVSLGQRVLVPFGGGNRMTEGFVVGLREQAAYTKGLKSILRPLENYSALTKEQLKLAFWMRENYNCLLIDALCTMIPAQMRGLRVKEKTMPVYSLAIDDIQPALDSLTAKTGACRAPVQRDVLQLLASVSGSLSSSDIQALIPTAAPALRALVEKGWVTMDAAAVRRAPKVGKTALSRPVLTEDQQTVTNAVCRSIDLAEPSAFLLKGVTGSGKTEVYMRIMEYALDLGRTAIVLVPEISLTPQTVSRFTGRFGDRVAVLHSRLSPGERFDEWKRIRTGQASVVVGARSAIFAPLEHLGLIIIDEEHEASYTSEKTPRYSAHEVARKRCELTGATLLLGSATPSLESYYLAKTGSYTLLELPHRVNGRPMPPVRIVDMRDELAAGNRSIFSAALLNAMRNALNRGEQIILFLNRRGYSTFVSCRGCGHVIQCDACDVSMTYHKSDHSLRCHYCGERKPVPQVCPQCGMPYLKYFGLGTQQVEEAVSSCFPTARVLRMDRDTTAKKDSHLAILNAFSNREADILIGTQMIAKGLDFPNVTLVGVVAADSTLHMPDFRAAERAFSLITQVAGRAGRDKADGQVIVQTYTPGHPSLQFARTHDYDGFFRREIGVRQQCLFPPFADFVRFLFSDPEYQKAKRPPRTLRKRREKPSSSPAPKRGLTPTCWCICTPCPRPSAFSKSNTGSRC